MCGAKGEGKGAGRAAPRVPSCPFFSNRCVVQGGAMGKGQGGPLRGYLPAPCIEHVPPYLSFRAVPCCCYPFISQIRSIQGPGSRVQVPGSRSRDQGGPGSRVQGPRRSRVQGTGSRVQGPGSRVQGCSPQKYLFE